MPRRSTPVLLSLTLGVALTAHFVLQTVLLKEVPALWLVAAETVAAALTAAAMSALSGTPRAERASRTQSDPATPSAAGAPVTPSAPRTPLAGALLPAVLGVLGLWAPQILVATNRFSDAPSGSESLFFTTAAWAPLVVVAALAVRKLRPTWTQAACVLLGVAGAALILANWERPSSFSPLVKFPVLETYMLAAGAAWAAHAAFLATRPAEDTRLTLTLGAAAAAVVSLIAAPVLGGPVSSVEIAGNLVPLLMSGATWGVAWWTWVALAGRAQAAAGGAALVLPPVFVTLLSFAEQAGTVYGPRPVQIVPALSGAVIVLLAVAGALEPRCYRACLTVRGRVRTLLIALASIVVATSFASLFLPRIAATVTGERSDGSPFQASWSMIGAETAGGWIALLLALALLARILTPATRRALVLWVLGAAIASAAYVGGADTHLRTWTRWIPPEVQQDYGTEYAHLGLQPLISWFERIGVGTSVAGLVALAALARRSDDENEGSSHEPTTEV